MKDFSNSWSSGQGASEGVEKGIGVFCVMMLAAVFWTHFIVRYVC